MKTTKLINWLLIDAAGAALSVTMLGFILPAWQPLFGIPTVALYVLAAIPVSFICFDLFTVFVRRRNYARSLRFIAVCNLLYCVFSLGLALFHFGQIRWLGWAYLVGEVAVVITLAAWELRAAERT